jgi:regulator of protease activity HflC (stomatin/prohibitin superfamily)
LLSIKARYHLTGLQNSWPLLILVFVSIRQVNQYERGVKFSFGKYSGLVGPGWRLVCPVIQSMTKVDIRTKAVEVPYQDAITRDNVSCKINAVIYYHIIDAARSVVEVENVWYAISQLAQTTMRNVVGEMSLDDLLSERDQASARIKELVASHAGNWGIEVQTVELKDISLPENMQRTIAKQAEAERERRAVIITSEGEVAAAENLRHAAEILGASPGAMHLRTLNSINDISSDQSNTVVFAVPLEVLRAFEGVTNFLKK